MRTLFSSILLTFFSIGAYSQIDTTNISHLQTASTKSEIISKYRGFVLDNIVENNKKMTKEIFYDVLSKFDKDYYTVFYPNEKWIIGLWLRDFDFVTSDIITFDSAAVAKLHFMVKPKEDQLPQVLEQIIDKYKDEITADLKSSTSLSTMDKEFLLLLIKTYISPNDKKYQDNINEAATEYLSNYPRSQYENYIRNYIRYEYAPGTFQFGIEYYGGVTLFSGKASDYFNSNGNFGFGLIWGIGKFQINTRVDFVFSRLKNDIDYEGVTWKNNERAQIMLMELSLGYQFQLSRKLMISPFMGIGGFSAMPYENDKKKNPDLKDVDISSYAAPVFGIDFCFYHKSLNYYNYFLYKMTHGSSSFNIRYTIQPISFPSKYEKMNGLSQNITLSFKLGIGKLKRVY